MSESAAKFGDDWDPTAERSPDELFAQYAEMRDCCPVASSSKWGGFWSLTRYDDVRQAARNHDDLSSARDGIWINDVRQAPLHSDRPEHTEMRRIIQPYFTPAKVASHEHWIRDEVRTILDDIQGSRKFDFVSAFSRPLPAIVLCRILGMDVSLAATIRTLSNRYLNAFIREDPASEREASRAIDRFIDSVINAAADSYEQGVGTRQDAPLTALMHAMTAGTIDRATASGILLLLFRAGHGTTTKVIGSSVEHLASAPDDQEFLRRNPDAVPTAVDEFLRCWGSQQAMARRAATDLVISDTTISEGDGVALIFTAANRDERKFENPELCDIRRSPNPHIAFGYGIHRCIGADLAKMETVIAVQEFLARTNSFRIVSETSHLPWPQYGPRHLMLEVDWAE